MFQDFDIGGFFRKYRKRILLSIFLFWAIFAILIMAEDEISVRLANLRVATVDRLQYIIRWVLWTLLTPLIITLAVKFPVRKKFLVSDIAKHFVLALLVIGLEFVVEIPVIRAATLRINGAVQPVVDYAAVFIQKLNIYLLLYYLVVGCTYLVLYIDGEYRSRVQAQQALLENQKLQTQLSEARLSFLKMQIDPHFLFNTHHSIISLMLDGQNDKAIKMLTRLSDLLRQSLENDRQTILLEQEVQLLKLYLDIQQIRFADRLHISFHLRPGALQQPVPSFILQPLVENAIKHGVSVSSLAEHITITGQVETGRLLLRVENDGSTINFNNFREGIGITNTRERLAQLYGGRASFELQNTAAGTVSATITIPL